MIVELEMWRCSKLNKCPSFSDVRFTPKADKANNDSIPKALTKRTEKVMKNLLCARISNLMLLLGSSNFQAATKRKLSDRALDVELDPGHLCEQIDVGGTDRTSAEPRICRDQVERLSQYADILQKERISERAVLPRNSTKASRNRDQDLRCGQRVHCKFSPGQQRFEIMRTDGYWH